MKTIAQAIARFIDRHDAFDFLAMIFISGIAVAIVITAVKS